MKKFSLLLLTLVVCCFTACHKDIWAELENLDQRVTKLEELCKEMNTNITSLQTIVDVLQANDYITGIVEIKKNGEIIGYTITFGKHDPITIYHGQDGKDGADGKDGQDGSANAPVIGVAQDTDGVYYWTLNGEWLLDDNGNKLPVSGKDGQNGTNGSKGQDGEDGKDGADGQDGKDGITPQLKIEDGYWYISYDNGATWTQLGKARGEDGKDGAEGQDGQDGDSMFQSVTQDENYVYFTLTDGTIIKIAKGNGNSQSNEDFIFTITYDPNGGEGVMPVDTFYYGSSKALITCTFTRKGHHFMGWNSKADGTGAEYADGSQITINKNFILYAQWKEYEAVDLGLSVLWATFNVGTTNPGETGVYFMWGDLEGTNTTEYYTSYWDSYKYCNGSYNSLTKYCTQGTYGVIDNKILLEIEDDAAHYYWGGDWRMPTKEEWEELITKCKWDKASMGSYYGGYKISGNGNEIYIENNVKVNGSTNGLYWSSSVNEKDPSVAYYMHCNIYSDIQMSTYQRACYIGIRPVKDKK